MFSNIFKNNIIVGTSLFMAILLGLAEYDRLYSKTPYEFMFYYQRSIWTIGIFNSIVRLFHPSHKHFFSTTHFKNDKILKENWKIMRDEIMCLYENKDNILNMKDLYSGFERIDSFTGNWKVFVIKWYDKTLDNAKILCPKTTEIIEQCDDIKAAMFSILEPGKYIPPHKGPFTGCLRYHLALKVPQNKEDCWINVNGEKKIWEEGESFIFDDTYTHSVYNNTNETRIVIFIDIVRPTKFPINIINNFLIKMVTISNFTKTINNIAEKQKFVNKNSIDAL